MDKLKKKVIESLKWKKHPSISSARIGISEEDYVKLKKEVLQEQLSKERESQQMIYYTQKANPKRKYTFLCMSKVVSASFVVSLSTLHMPHSANPLY